MHVPPKPDYGMLLSRLPQGAHSALVLKEDHLSFRRNPVHQWVGNRTIGIKDNDHVLVCRTAAYDGCHFFVRHTISFIQVTSLGEIRVDIRPIENCEASKDKRTRAKCNVNSANAEQKKER